ncbi:MAG: Phosphatidylinositol 3- and 4-kinase [bacterium ADurb.Bin400]|nr:MAG: Phosphatidylinositol 3- and 4-kinase [bacterium ADurb.Bin400]
MAMLDRLINNADRNAHNLLVCLNDQTKQIAIDHGCSFCMKKKTDDSVAWEYFRNNPELATLDDELTGCLRSLLEHQDEVKARMPEDIRRRLEAGIEPRVFETAQKMLGAGTILV